MTDSSQQPAPAGGQPTHEVLRQAPIFAGLPASDLDHLRALATERAVAAGEVLIVEGEPGDSLYVILDGELEVVKRAGDRQVVLAVRRAGEVIGEQSLLERSPRSASVRALRPSRVLMIDEAAFRRLLEARPTARDAILETLTKRLRSTGSLLMQHEKLAALGTLAAGLAHELNNPAAAMQRAAEQTSEAVVEWERLAADLAAMPLDQRQRGTIHRLLTCLPERPPAAELDPLARSDREEALLAWLEAREVAEPWRVASALVENGWERADVEGLTDGFEPAVGAAIVRWLAAGLTVHRLLDEMGKSARAISGIVRAIKTYSFVGQAPIQDVDLRESIDNTLVILHHKLKSGVEVHRHYAPDVAEIEGYGSELAQVWTNLIDNAIQAMEGKGTIEITVSRRSEQEVAVEVVDSGPGIPPDVLPRVFEPFFTTKPPGIGSGLGLHIVYNIVVDKHHGRISVESQPGRTRFEVILPVRLAHE